MHERQPTTTFLVPVKDYEELRGEFDDPTLERAFVGRWPSRKDFGDHLIADTNAKQQIAALPKWLRDYIWVDVEAYVGDLEHAGIFVIRDVESGVCVFDAPLTSRQL